VMNDEDCQGSSPRSRGGLPNQVTTRTPLRAHPRVRGEDFSFDIAVKTPGGSSPRSRGGPQLNLAVAMPVGLIPAFAGRTLDHQRQLHSICRFTITWANIRRLQPADAPCDSGLPCSTLRVAWQQTRALVRSAVDG